MTSSVSDSSDVSGRTRLTYFQEQAYRVHYRLVNRVIKAVKDRRIKKKTSSQRVNCEGNIFV